jgi:hypothetical protein
MFTCRSLAAFIAYGAPMIHLPPEDTTKFSIAE